MYEPTQHVDHLGDITSSSCFVDRPNNLAGTSSPVQGLPMPALFNQDWQTLEERKYFERATSGNGSKRQSYFYNLVSLCASNPWTKCALQTYVSVNPLIVRGGNLGAFADSRKKTSEKAKKGSGQGPSLDLGDSDSSPGSGQVRFFYVTNGKFDLR